jgi:hypothetical protein
MKIHATNLARHGYGKGWQVNALVDGIESEATFYGVAKEWALRQAKAIIESEGKLPHVPYDQTDRIFKGFKEAK